MYKLCLGLSFAAVAMLVSCSGENGSNVSDLVELSDSSEADVTGSSAADSGISKVSSSSKSKDAGSSESGGSSSSGSQDTGSSESIDSSSSGSEDSGSSESSGSSSSSFEESSSSESEESSSSSEEEFSSSEEPESSSEEVSSSSVPLSSSDASIYDATANTLTDLRDNQVYRTTTIDIPSKNYSEVWMAENMNFETENSWCGGGSGMAEGDCSVYGRLYTWAASVGKTEDECGNGKQCSLGTGDIRGICPKGWHLPSRDEWEELITAVGTSVPGNELKSKTGWNSTSGAEFNDPYLFSALPAGGRFINGSFGGVGDNACFWSSLGSEKNAQCMDLDGYGEGLAAPIIYFKNSGYSVRCLKN